MHILLVEDDPLIANGIATGLRLHKMTVDMVNSASRARAAIATASFDACILDLGLPDEDGITLLHSWRSQGINIPILILSARDSVLSRVKGLQEGADDYLLKPFELDELSARLHALVRRIAGHHSDVMVHGDLSYKASTGQVWLDGRLIDLSRRELALLRTLLQYPQNIVSAEQLHNSLYGFDQEVESNAINVHIHNLRRKLGNHIIETVRGVGYKLGIAKE